MRIFPNGRNQGIFFCRMKPRDQRALSVDETIASLRGKFFMVPGIMAFPQNPPPITVSGQFTSSVYSVTLQSTDLKQLYAWTPKAVEAMSATPGFVDVNSDLQVASPQATMNIDRDRAQSLGVSPQQIQDALQSSFGDRQVSLIYQPANEYEVILELDPKYQRSPDALHSLYVHSSAGPLIPLRFSRSRRAHRRSAIRESLRPASGDDRFLQSEAGLLTRSGDCRCAECIPEHPHAEHDHHQLPGNREGISGIVPKSHRAADRGGFYLIVLGILYESFIHPITILSGLPSALFGALATLLLFHRQLDLYAFVGVIMLFGVVKKNAIMMIDFAIQERRQGATAYDAIYKGCLLRFRPIMMTTVAALIGTLRSH